MSKLSFFSHNYHKYMAAQFNIYLDLKFGFSDEKWTITITTECKHLQRMKLFVND